MASGEERSQSPATAGQPPTRRRAVLRAVLRGAVFGATIIAIGLVGVVCLEPYRWSNQLPQPSQFSSQLHHDRPVAAALVVLFCAALGALLFGVAAVLSPRPHPDESNALADKEGQPGRPYAQSLRQFLQVDVRSEPGDVPSSPSRYAFFASLLPGGPTLPKSAAYIRAILWRIHRRLGRRS